MFTVTIDYLTTERIIKMTTHGVFDLTADKELVAQGVAAAKQHGCWRFLVDHRQVELKMRQFDVEDVPLVAAKAGLPAFVSIALLHNDSPRARELFTFVEDVSVLTNGPRRVFTDDDTAMRWLESRPDVSA